MSGVSSPQSRPFVMRELEELREAIVGERAVWRGDYERLEAIRAELQRLQGIEEQLQAAQDALRSYFNQHNRSPANQRMFNTGHCVCSYCEAARRVLNGDSIPAKRPT